MLEFPPVRISTWFCVAWILLPAPIGRAAPADCPVVADTSKCELIVGETRFVVAASDAGAGSFAIDAWEIGGVRQVAPGYSGFAFRDFSTAPELPVSSQLEAATVDVETATIFIRFQELVSGAPGPFSLSVEFGVGEDGGTSILTRIITVHNQGAETALSRVYDVMDMDLGGTAVDEFAFVVPSGPTIFQGDGSILAETGVDSGPAADGYELAPCPPCDLSDLLGDATFDLSNIATAEGPADFQSALSWNQKLAPDETFHVMLETTISPEPEAAARALGAVLALLACSAIGNRRAGTGPGSGRNQRTWNEGPRG